MRLGRRLTTGVAEHPPAREEDAPQPAEQERPARSEPVTAERRPADLVTER